jgi:hypothetical protein
MIGFPLRLLAREVYDRVVKRSRARRASRADHRRRKDHAPHARYFLLGTMEALPIEARLSPSSGSTKRSSAPIPNAAMSSPTGCCAHADARKR